MTQTITLEQIQAINLALVRLRQAFMEFGMYETYQALQAGMDVAGYEAASIALGEHPTKLVCPHDMSYEDCPDCRH